jgi:FAD/FMN-containing dehydrogenase
VSPNWTKAYESWGRVLRLRHRVHRAAWLSDAQAAVQDDAGPVLAYGHGRSYGDSCLNADAALVDMGACDRLIAFDRATGRLRCEAGMSLAQILDLAVPHGFFLPVTPGTKHVTVGGAIANDVHGKNHHVAGTFGEHVTRFALLRSDGSLRECAPDANPELFRATIGGLGLTGLIVWAEVQLKRVASPLIEAEQVRFGNLDEFYALDRESAARYEYTVAWTDCLATGSTLGRGVYFRGNHAPAEVALRPTDQRGRPPLVTVPLQTPSFLMLPLVMRLFNETIFRLHKTSAGPKLTHWDPFFYPLDRVLGWNKLYGHRGFYQYQLIVPEDDPKRLEEVFRFIARSGRGSFLTVLKRFGARAPAGMMSFPRAGITLALDFANRDAATARFLAELDRVVADAGGRAYPAKDAVMTPETFARFYPEADAFAPFVDPKFSSSFWRRVRCQPS